MELKWIKFEDELPAEREDVLIYTSPPEEGVHIGNVWVYYENYIVRSPETGNIIAYATHWAEVPYPPILG